MPPSDRRPAGVSSHWPAEAPQSYESRFGRGYTIIFWISFVTVVSLIVNAGVASTMPARWRRIGLLLVGFGGSFLAGSLYQSVVVKAFANVGRSRGELQTRIITPRSNPIGYWATLIFFFVVSLGFVIGGVWLFLHADFLASQGDGVIRN